MTTSERRARFRKRLRTKAYAKDGILCWKDTDLPVPPRVMKAAEWEVNPAQVAAYKAAFPDEQIPEGEVELPPELPKAPPAGPFKILGGEGNLAKQKEDALLRQAFKTNPKR